MRRHIMSLRHIVIFLRFHMSRDATLISAADIRLFYAFTSAFRIAIASDSSPIAPITDDRQRRHCPSRADAIAPSF